MSDLIERTAVLDLMRTNWADNDGDTAMQLSIDDVRDLPTAAPVEDAVSREAALKALAELPHEYKTKEQRARTGGIAACQVIVRELPPVTLKPKTGKWTDAKLYFDSSWATCSECKECARQKTENDGWGFSIWFLKYCPNCGAKMEGESE